MHANAHLRHNGTAKKFKCLCYSAREPEVLPLLVGSHNRMRRVCDFFARGDANCDFFLARLFIRHISQQQKYGWRFTFFLQYTQFSQLGINPCCTVSENLYVCVAMSVQKCNALPHLLLYPTHRYSIWSMERGARCAKLLRKEWNCNSKCSDIMTATLHTRLHSNNNNSAKWKPLACKAMQQMSLKKFKRGASTMGRKQGRIKNSKKYIYMYV